MDSVTINGVEVTPLKNIFNPKGNVLHALKKSESSFVNFGEAYFSTINYNDRKAWKKHTKMTLNLIVPAGEIKFVLYDDREESETKGNFFEIILSLDNYKRLTVPPGIWMGFQGKGKDLNLLLNVASIEHDPSEGITREIEEIQYDWRL